MGETTRDQHDWALVLAAGEGSRLSSLTQRDGTAIPKQFWSLAGGRTLLGETLDRAERLVAGDRVVTVAAARHERWWRPELTRLPAANVIVQPENRGAAAVGAAYERLPNLDFSRALLQGSEEWLRLLPVPHCEWSDLGTPERVARCLSRGKNEPRGTIERLAAWASPLVLAAAFQPMVAEA